MNQTRTKTRERGAPAGEQPVVANRGVEYADVFISHKKEDTQEAKALAERVRQLGFSCYLDVFDPELADKSAGALAQHIRSELRGALALLFYVSPQAIESKWMPWELGFFDGRWGKGTIGIYLPAEVNGHAKANANAEAKGNGLESKPGAFSIQEYLEIYDQVSESTLASFLHRATSIDMLANRSDVDIDRAMSMMAAAMRNPMAFQLGWCKFMLGSMRPMLAWQPLALQQVDAWIGMLGQAREWAGRQGNVLTAAEPQGELSQEAKDVIAQLRASQVKLMGQALTDRMGQVLPGTMNWQAGHWNELMQPWLEWNKNAMEHGADASR